MTTTPSNLVSLYSYCTVTTVAHYTFDTGTVRTEIGYHQISIEGLEIDVLALWLKKWRERSHQWEGLFAVDEKNVALLP